MDSVTTPYDKFSANSDPQSWVTTKWSCGTKRVIVLLIHIDTFLSSILLVFVVKRWCVNTNVV